MKVIIPMAGLGDRFVQKGYSDPKPLIKVDSKPIIEHIVEMFSKDDDFLFICNDVHLKTTQVRRVLEELVSSYEIVSIPQHKKGPVHTILPFIDRINDEESVIVSYCDNPLVWNREIFEKYVDDNNLDGCIMTHTGFHPHTLSNTKMAFLKVSEGAVVEVKEKESYTAHPMQEHASTGVYYFKKGSYLKKYFTQLIEQNINYNGEYYVTLVYNLLIKDNLKVGYYNTDFVTVFGTPEEVENYKAWRVILEKNQVKSELDLINCYRYWENYTKLKSKINIG